MTVLRIALYRTDSYPYRPKGDFWEFFNFLSCVRNECSGYRKSPSSASSRSYGTIYSSNTVP
jgi:hypothetical protein